MTLRWQQAVSRCSRQGTPFVLATVLATSGSTPRGNGAKMVITRQTTYDSIGGGQLEQLVITRAHELLAGTTSIQEVTHFPLAAAALQCCGGSMTVLLESFGLDSIPVTLFGAGHVAQRLAALLHDLSIPVTLIDHREAQLAGITADVEKLCLETPESAVEGLDANSFVLVMTHDHLLDYRLIKALLDRSPIAFVGMIGSSTKWQRFTERLRQDGVPVQRIRTVQCPIGLDTVPGKEPMAVAISVAAQLLQERQRRTRLPSPPASLSWRQIRSSLVQEASIDAAD